MKRCRLSTSRGMHFTASGITLLRQINNRLEALIPPRALSAVPKAKVQSPNKIDTGALPLIHWEFPRLCRGGSRSLTFQGVVFGHPSMKLRFVSRQSTRTMEFHRWTSCRA